MRVRIGVRDHDPQRRLDVGRAQVDRNRVGAGAILNPQPRLGHVAGTSGLVGAPRALVVPAATRVNASRDIATVRIMLSSIDTVDHLAGIFDRFSHRRAWWLVKVVGFEIEAWDLLMPCTCSARTEITPSWLCITRPRGETALRQ